jgi:hypothetical protein
MSRFDNSNYFQMHDEDEELDQYVQTLFLDDVGEHGYDVDGDPYGEFKKEYDGPAPEVGETMYPEVAAQNAAAHTVQSNLEVVVEKAGKGWGKLPLQANAGFTFGTANQADGGHRGVPLVGFVNVQQRVFVTLVLGQIEADGYSLAGFHCAKRGFAGRVKAVVITKRQCVRSLGVFP